VGEEAIAVEVRGGDVAPHERPAEGARAVISTDHLTLAMLGTGRVTPLQALAEGRISVQGAPAAAERRAALFGVAAQGSEAAAGDVP
jgi:putative sterol carrier protein